jgi:DNA-binding PadR family transcriptional regulator
VRTAVLLLLDEGPMHGYQLMQAIAERSRGTWQPSPGAVYPLLGQLEDEGLITISAEGGRRLARLTEAGRAAVAAGRASWSDPFAGHEGAAGSDLRPLLAQLHDAARQVARAGDDTQLAAAGKILTDARRALYLLLAGEDEAPEPDRG